jgi:hypothetical protein
MLLLTTIAVHSKNHATTGNALHVQNARYQMKLNAGVSSDKI